MQLIKQNDVVSSIITMFGQLSSLQADKKTFTSIEGNNLKIEVSENSNQVDLNFDYSKLEKKIFKWINDTSLNLTLNKSDSEIFIKCSHAAYYFLTENEDPEILEGNPFIKFHEKFFKKKLNEEN